MRTLTPVFVVLSGALVLVCASACGTTSSSGTGTGTGTGTGSVRSEQTYCDQREARAKACSGDAGGAPVTFNRASCGEDYTCSMALLASPDAYLGCRANPDCSTSTSDGQCFGSAAQGRTVAQSDPCAKKYAECKSAGGKSFDDDTCGALSALNDAALQKVSACIEKPCDQISDCIDATVKAISPACD